MRSRIKTTLAMVLVIPIAGVSVRSAGAQASPPSGGAASAQATDDSKPLPFEIEGGYTFLMANQPPGTCGCFGMQGGNGTFAWAIKNRGFAAVGDVAVVNAGAIASTGYSLTVVAVTGGLRYRVPVKTLKIQPYGQALFGIAHASGTGAQYPNPEAGNAGAAFAMNAGGGVDVRVSPKFSVRVVEAGLLMTNFDNLANGRQYNLRLGAGAVFRF
jgi:outer membrane immunogenic protein